MTGNSTLAVATGLASLTLQISALMRGETPAVLEVARLLVAQHRYADAIGHLEKTIEPDDEASPAYLYALGAALARAGESKKAVARLEEARSRAQARGQAQLVASIERDLRTLGGAKP